MSKGWWEAHPEKKRAKQRRQRAQNLERTKARERRNYWAHAEARRAAARTYQKTHRAEANARQRKYAAAHPGVQREKLRRRKLARPLAASAAAARRYALKKGAMGSHTDADWIVLLWASGWCCAYCHTRLDERTVTRDHKIPLARGGSNDIANIAVACESCNKRKHTMTDTEFAARLERLDDVVVSV